MVPVEEVDDNTICKELSLPNMITRSSSSASEESTLLNGLDGKVKEDFQGIGLLKQIFPDEPTEELRRIHHERLAKSRQQRLQSALFLPQSTSTPRSRLGKRIQKQLGHSVPQWRECLLANDFLRLPPHVAVRRYCEDSGRWQYQLVTELTNKALQQHRLCLPEGGQNLISEEYYTKVLFRDPKVGLGMTLYEERGNLRVHSLTSRDGRQWLESPAPMTPGVANGPSLQAGVAPGDVLIGINGSALLESVSPDHNLLQHAVASIRESPDPIVLHLRKAPSQHENSRPPPASSLRFHEIPSTPSLLDTSDMDNSTPEEISFSAVQCLCSTPEDLPGKPPIHPFIAALGSRGLISSTEEQLASSHMLKQFTERARQWDAASCFGTDSLQTFISLVGVRRALCVRIVNSFLDGYLTAYTIWVYDVESGSEWYAPVRYFRDFQDLRSATVALCPSVTHFPFPKQGLSLFGSPVRAETVADRELRCRQLERFLRSLCGMLYRNPLHHGMGEVAVHVQSFLGCDAAFDSEPVVATTGRPLISEGEWFSQRGEDAARKARVKMLLKRSLQIYTHRLFLLDMLCSIVDNFVDTVRARGPRLQDIEMLEAEGRSVLKERAMKDLVQIQAFLDQLQELVIESCMGDFRSIAEQQDCKYIQEMLHGNKERGATVVWDRLVREAVREQIEIEVYVPLRSLVSRWLVNGWRHEDMEVHFKIKELRKRPQHVFRIPEEKLSPSNWQTVSTILKEGVGMSTLPCVKLRAIVEAAREISNLLSSESRHQSQVREDTQGIIGADDFLPIFIYTVVQAEMERPCALCVLLQTICDRINRIGEVGYYFASFEAAVTHIQEVDLTEDREGMISIALGD